MDRNHAGPPDNGGRSPAVNDGWKEAFQDKDFTSDWTSLHFPTWTRVLASMRERAVEILEIGSWEGRSAIFFLEFLKRSRITCIDTFKGNPGPITEQYHLSGKTIEDRFDSNTRLYGDRLTKIRARSVQAMDILWEDGRSFDLIYIDGNHHRDDVLIDSLLAWRLLKPEGILIWDDYKRRKATDPERQPKQAIELLVFMHAPEIVEIDRGRQLIIQRMRGRGRRHGARWRWALRAFAPFQG